MRKFNGRTTMKQNRHCFTLVEILMVTGMICMIAALIVVAYNGVYRSWSTGNTVATMKAAHLALDRYMLENNSYPVQAWDNGNNGSSAGYLRFSTNSSSAPSVVKLAKDILQECAPYSYETSNHVVIFDDFGAKPPATPNAIHYVFPYGNRGFALMSKGKDGVWGGNDDIIYLSAGDPDHGLKPGFYNCSIESDGDIASYTDIEPIAQ
ncbi:MAG: hypothetical protein IKA65_01335 [Lentisphaeria bacterium]|nr:hypothetical protein [Lentisphaeria bacterium]